MWVEGQHALLFDAVLVKVQVVLENQQGRINVEGLLPGFSPKQRLVKPLQDGVESFECLDDFKRGTIVTVKLSQLKPVQELSSWKSACTCGSSTRGSKQEGVYIACMCACIVC
jgi:hypothetical protein